MYWCGEEGNHSVSVGIWRIKTCWRETRIFQLEKNKFEISTSPILFHGNTVANYHWGDLYDWPPFFKILQLTKILNWNHLDSWTAYCNEMSLLLINLFVEINVATNTMTVLNIALWFLFFLLSEFVFWTLATDRGKSETFLCQSWSSSPSKSLCGCDCAQLKPYFAIFLFSHFWK